MRGSQDFLEKVTSRSLNSFSSGVGGGKCGLGLGNYHKVQCDWVWVCAVGWPEIIGSLGYHFREFGVRARA